MCVLGEMGDGTGERRGKDVKYIGQRGNVAVGVLGCYCQVYLRTHFRKDSERFIVLRENIQESRRN